MWCVNFSDVKPPVRTQRKQLNEDEMKCILADLCRKVSSTQRHRQSSLITFQLVGVFHSQAKKEVFDLSSPPTHHIPLPT